jgi:hypothetical protein
LQLSSADQAKLHKNKLERSVANSISIKAKIAGQQVLNRLNGGQRHALDSFEATFSKRFLKKAKSYKFCEPLSQVEFAKMVSELLPARGAVSKSRLSTMDATAHLFEKYANNVDGKVQYQSLSRALRRVNDNCGSGCDPSREARDAWSAVKANRVPRRCSSTTASFSVKCVETETELIHNEPVAQIFGDGFPLADICTNWKSIRQAMMRASRAAHMPNGCIKQDEACDIFAASFGIEVSAAHLQRLRPSGQHQGDGILRYDQLLKVCLQAKAAASRVARRAGASSPTA